MSKHEQTKHAYIMASVAGVVLWLAVTAISGANEAWDSPLYWLLGYPLSIVIAGVLGYRVPERPWRWGLTIMLSQAVTLAVVTSSFGLLPLGLILFSILALPLIGAAKLGAKMRLGKQAT